MTGFVAMPGSLGPWHGGQFEAAECVLAPNPGMMTLDGTNTWLIEADPDSVVIIDPGPDDPAHLQAVRAALGDRWVREIWLTHGHADHSAGAGLFAGVLRCPVRALDPAHRLGDEGLTAGDHATFGDSELRVLATPGHTSDSLCFYLPRQAAILTGDTILGRGTTVVAHPDGRLAEYLASLNLLAELCAEHDVRDVWPGHGPVLSDAAAVVAAYQRHRRERLAEVAAAIADLGTTSTPALVAQVYADVPRALWPAAELSLRAQVDFLVERGALPGPALQPLHIDQDHGS